MAVNDEDPYALLGVAPDAPDAVIAAAWRSLARSAHPDAGGDTRTFQALEAAYHLLSDPGRRAEYDRVRKSAGWQAGGCRSGRSAATANFDGDGAPFWSDWQDAAADANRRWSEQARRDAEANQAASHRQAVLREHTRIRFRSGPVSPAGKTTSTVWPLVWRFGLLGLLFASFAGHVLGHIPRMDPIPVSGFAASLTACSMLLAAAGLVSLVMGLRPGLHRRWSTLVAVYSAATVLTVVAFEADWSGISSTAVIVGTVGLVVGDQRRLLG